MDSYLESLVLKKETLNEEKIETELEVSASDEINEVDESVVAEESPENQVQSKFEQSETSEPETTIAPISSSEPIVVEIYSISSSEPIVVEIYSVSEETETKDSTSIDCSYIPNEIYSVENIKVYRTPDVDQSFKIVSGNIIYINKIDDFSEIKYMKPGFGLVSGFTLDL